MWMWIRVSVHKHLKYLSNWDSSYNTAWRCMCSSIALCHLLLLSVFPGLSVQDNHPEGNWKPGKLPSSRATWLTVVWEVSCTFRIFCESQPNLDFLGCIYIYIYIPVFLDKTTHPKRHSPNPSQRRMQSMKLEWKHLASSLALEKICVPEVPWFETFLDHDSLRVWKRMLAKKLLKAGWFLPLNHGGRLRQWLGGRHRLL